MLKQRVITALILAPLVIGAVLMMPNQYLALVFAGILLAAGHEWAILSGLPQHSGQFAFILILLLLMLGAFFLFTRNDWVLWLLVASVVWWIIVIIRLRRFQGEEKLEGVNLPQALEGLIVLVPAWLALILIHRLPEDGPLLLIFLLILIWSADIGAYFSGRAWGRVKLAPCVSPGKTREGVYGAMVGAFLCGLLLAWWQQMSLSDYPLAVLLCLITALFSVAGDLFESMVKRQRGVKDSGNLLPGHGGILDRIDSLTAAAPIFLLGLILMGKSL